eukprot:TRINITY_DN10092_c0_g1_i4.p1 TRINITY_DN10092_c0_g1~~TRINITY_DN10092_c0_g1_i4.p1  ORF type:complete len:679 (+),score=137.53 TRINITY_DN10092_c0_g1_i4:559-2595(+)
MCLDLFASQTQIAFTEMKKDFRLMFVQIRLDTIQNKITEKDGTVYTDGMHVPFRYSPNYWRLSGYDKTLLKYSDQTSSSQQDLLVEEMVQEFWSLLRSKHYYSDPNLSSQVSSFLRVYIKAGLCNQLGIFSPHHKSLALYLYGSSGIGKSSFVKLFSQVFGRIIQKHVEPRKRFALVKVPLNCMTPPVLKKILHVRGISDWSIERIVEQTIARGGIAVLHLEENPENQELQDSLFTLTQNLLESITYRYPEYSSNLLYVITSNYRASQKISQVAQVVEMRPPSISVQHEWCVSVLVDSISHTLHHLIGRYRDEKVVKATLEGKTDGTTPTNIAICGGTKEMTDDTNLGMTSEGETERKSNVTIHREKSKMKLVDIHVNLINSPPVSNDMRLLEKWKMVLDFYISRHVFFARESLSSCKTSTFDEEEKLSTPPTTSAPLQITVTIAGPSKNQVDITFKGVDVFSSQDSLEKISPLTLHSFDGYFFFNSQASSPLNTPVPGLPLEQAFRVNTVIEMLDGRYLKPAVIVITNEKRNNPPSSPSPPSPDGEMTSRKIQFEKAICSHVTSIYGSRLHTIKITARSEEDTEQIFGNPSSPIMGGLPAFVDHVTNPIYTERKDDFVLVVIHANEYGQYILREMLENNDSETHRTLIKKERVLFLVVTDGLLSPQMESRAHLIINL